MPRPICFENISFILSQKVCFESFSATLLHGSRVAIIGRNGAGKSSLLKIISGQLDPSGGELDIPIGLSVRYVPQIICIPWSFSDCFA